MSCPENARYLTNAGCQHSPANAIGSRDEAVRWCDEALAVVEAELAKMIASVDRRCRWDVYTGLGGYALMYLRLSESEAAGRGRAEALLGKARVCVDLAMRLCGDDPKAESLLCGPLGIFAIAAVVLARQGDRTSAAAHVAKIRQALRSGVQEPQATSDELLYGRAGWLTVALFVNAHLDPALRVEDDVLRPIVAAILAKGERTAATEPRAPSDPTWTLLFRWHGKAYLGAAHGTAGIVQTLLCRPDLLPPGGLALLHKTIHELIDAATANGGHLPSSLHSTPSSSGRLVQWCHGSPGFCLMLCRACAVFKDDPELLNQARIAANMTWKRGLLRKGVGLCHGISGNAYAFLALYKVTRDPSDLGRAWHFARVASKRSRLELDGLLKVPDHPWSLYEGLAGCVCFFSDLASDYFMTAVDLFPGMVL